MKFKVIIEKGPTSYGAYIPDLPGCVAVGKSTKEVVRLIKEAAKLHVKKMREDGDSIPKPPNNDG